MSFRTKDFLYILFQRQRALKDKLKHPIIAKATQACNLTWVQIEWTVASMLSEPKSYLNHVAVARYLPHDST
ncbi:hypothetical protein AQUCO_01700516v1 [Aquilegia coerulea]|uniref:Uncharacterized protein n=1 Tax=Aquilegia coerulea TaxID=218851 RepID=A0A2G5DNC8_AQUCA|nr:hypothetical protein AQUCO_01700516v1 [Aquilegia coerulea]